MPSYRYVARTDADREVAGTVAAGSVDAARALLHERGLRIIELSLIAPRDGAQPAALTEGESVEFARGVAQVAAGNVPLAPGLRAAADESPSPRVRVALLWLARQIEQGRPLEQAIDEAGGMIPAYLVALIRAALRNDCLGEALFALVEHQQAVGTLLRRCIGSLAYSFIVLGLGALILGCIIKFIAVYQWDFITDFGLRPPAPTRALMWFQSTGIYVVLIVVLVGAILAASYRLIAGRAAWQRFVATLPLVGVLIHWTRLVDWTGLTRILLANGLTLPEALRLAGDGVRSASVGELSHELAEGVTHGRSLAELLRATPLFPASLLPVLYWGEKGGVVSEAMQISQEALQQRVLIRARLVQAIVPPTVFIVLGCAIMFVVSAFFLPMIDLIRQLS